MIKPMQPEQAAAVLALFNGAAKDRDIIHKPLTPEIFHEKFIATKPGEQKINLVYEEGGKLVGFGSAYHKLGADLGYITFVYVSPERRRQGLGSELLAALEAQLKGYPIKKINLNFFNPVNLEWLIDKTPGHDHPNTPGVDVESPAFPFYQHHGYVETARQYSYYRLLEDFAFQPKIAQRVESLKEKEITITYYDPELHHGLEELMDDLKNPDWHEKILGNARSEKPYPLLIVQQRGRVGGFAGPLFVQESGRGYFAGIGIHSEFRDHGAGSALFSGLCQGLKEVGASFMSLFTGKENVARKIYESAGFEVVHEWACMTKGV